MMITRICNRPERRSVTTKLKSQIDDLLLDYDLGYRMAHLNRMAGQVGRLSDDCLSQRRDQRGAVS